MEDGRITHVGSRAKQSRPAQARLIDAEGAFVVPLLVDTAARARPEDQRGVYDLAPGNPANFAVTRERVSEPRIRHMLVLRPRDLLAVVVSGHLEVQHGEPTRPAGVPDPGDDFQQWHGVWVDDSRELEQHLLPDGRYTETRHGRTDAYTGRYWVHNDRITYLDDTGFWAFGELLSGVLHHAGFVMSKRLATPG
ncbi:Atu4866 domain-containing protein [Phytoactinopolyspora endophytica]|uniref:Atu4866 domain-containing protein n=1 Tax=Phytoactinopolyspora endophytica TaxID=1642495 RepID=UPI00101D0DB6|nr:Atu4866 domain-containing protein [Phytoactinopolyspora endophytica]